VHAFSPETNRNIIVTIDVIGIVGGIIMLAILFPSFMSFSASLRRNYDFMLWIGILFQVLALAYSLVFIRLGLFPIPRGIDVHHLLMIIGFIFFGIAIYNLRIMMNTINKKK
jgi:hypothetical protein